MSSKLLPFLALAWHTIRGKTLAVTIAIIMLSQGLAWHDMTFLNDQALDYFLSAIILTCCLLLQISVNLANDYFDGLKGIDNPQRLGPQRAIQAGLIKPVTLRNAIFLTTALACLFGLYLIFKGGWTFFFLGLLSLFGIYAYSGGQKPLASLGLGELAVFLYFGYLGVMASYVLQTGEFNTDLFFPATQIGLLISAIMLINNIRDIESDKAAGKQTLAVRIGHSPARKLCAGLLILPFLLIPFDHYQPFYNFFLLPITLYLCIKIQRTDRNQGELFNRYLGQTSALVLAWSTAYLFSLLIN